MEVLEQQVVFLSMCATHAMLMNAAFPPYRKERLRTCRTKVRYWRGRTGMEAHTEKSRLCREVRNNDRQEERRSASCSISPAAGRSKWGDLMHEERSMQSNIRRWDTGSSSFSFVSVQDESVPGSAQQSTQLGHGKSIGVLTHYKRRRDRKILIKTCSLWDLKRSGMTNDWIGGASPKTGSLLASRSSVGFRVPMKR